MLAQTLWGWVRCHKADSRGWPKPETADTSFLSLQLADFSYRFIGLLISIFSNILSRNASSSNLDVDFRGDSQAGLDSDVYIDLRDGF